MGRNAIGGLEGLGTAYLLAHQVDFAGRKPERPTESPALEILLCV